MTQRPSRTPDQLRRHYEVEKDLAQRLLHSTREQRTALFQTMYADLFARVPDHPRLVQRDTEEASHAAVAARMRLLRDQLGAVKTFLEFAPGDCSLAFEVCRHAEQVFAVDISDQTSERAVRPPNFHLIVYDGYHLDLPDDFADLAFSYQFIEHLHPDDIQEHFLLAKRILKPGGAYIFCTPHRFSGPHDISRFFSDTPQGFHFKEWTYRELDRLLGKVGFSGWYSYRCARLWRSQMVNKLTLGIEAAASLLPTKIRRNICRRLFQSVTMIAYK